MEPLGLLVLAPADLDALTAGNAHPIAFVDALLRTLVESAPCVLELSPADEDPVLFRCHPEHHLDPSKPGPVVGSCSRALLRSVLARLCHHLLPGQVYAACGHRYLQYGARTIRCMAFVSNDQLSGYWFRLHASLPTEEPPPTRPRSDSLMRSARAEEALYEVDPGPLAFLEGSQLSSVEFVQDYVQLRFDGPCLNAYVWPSVVAKDHTFTLDRPGYRDALCARIARKVVRARSVEEMAITLDFDDASTISLSLRPDDQTTPEAAELRDGDTWIVW